MTTKNIYHQKYFIGDGFQFQPSSKNILPAVVDMRQLGFQEMEPLSVVDCNGDDDTEDEDGDDDPHERPGPTILLDQTRGSHVR